MSLLKNLNESIKTQFSEHPFAYFSEHDIHTELANNAKEYLDSKNDLWVITKDNNTISRVHHEYPTPFRCLMKGTLFRMFSEEKFKIEKTRNPKLRVKRGYFDLVVFNKEYINNNNFQVVTGKNYRYLLKSFEQDQRTALDLAIEVVYYLGIDNKSHEGIMRRRIESTIQDYEKLTSLMDFKHDGKTPFCKEAAMMLFINTPYKNLMKENIKSIKTNKKVQLLTYLI